MNIKKYILNEFIKNKNDTNSQKMSSYMRNKFLFLGIKRPLLQNIYRSISSEIKKLSHTELKELCLFFWHEKYREFHYFTLEILQHTYKKFSQDDLNFFLKLVNNQQWWDTIDILKKFIAFILDESNRVDEVCHELIKNENLWVRRTALLVSMTSKTQPFSNHIKLIKVVNHEDEFFIQKAIGWSLREFSKRIPAEVKEYIQNTDLSKLADREGMKIINKQAKF